MFVFAFISGKEQQEFFNSDYNVEAKSSYSIAGWVFTNLLRKFLRSMFGQAYPIIKAIGTQCYRTTFVLF